MEYLTPLIQSFRANADSVRAEKMKQYMKGLFPFIGIDTKTRTALQKEFFGQFGYPLREKLFEVVFALWDLPEREYQMCAISLLRKKKDELYEQDIDYLEKLLTAKSWWDSVDGLSAWICGSYFSIYPHMVKAVTEKWVSSDNFWLQRASLLFQLSYKKNTDIELLANYIDILKDEKEFFIRKAIGWVLREYSKTNPEWVRAFVRSTKISPLSYREASKYI